MAAANAIGRSGSVSPTKWPIVTDRPWTRNAAMATPESTTHHRCRSAYVIVISWDLSPSSARKTTPRLTRAADSMREPFDASPGGQPWHGALGQFGRRSRPPHVGGSPCRACASMSTRRLGATPLR